LWELFIYFKITMQKGKVKFFNETKGFGFIKTEGSQQDVFVHVSGLVDEIQQDDEVSFEIEQGKKGLIAVNVKLVK
jgi:cold shock protein